MNSAENFWAHVDRTAGPDSCWPWLLSRDRQGRGWYRYGGKVKFAHHVAEFLTSGSWPRRRQIISCANDPGCCNPNHLQRCQPKRRRSFSRARKSVEHKISRQRAFTEYLQRTKPDLMWLINLLGTNAATFLRQHEGRTVRLEIDIPSRAELIEQVRAIDCWLTIAERPDELTKTMARLTNQYRCTSAQIVAFAKLGSRLLNAANEESCDVQ